MKRSSIVPLAGMVTCIFVLHVPAAEAAKESTVYEFCSQQNCTDGMSPFGALTNLHGTLYGTTQFGGGMGCSDVHGCGAVFAIDPAKHIERVLHSFSGGDTDGAAPVAGLIDVHSVLYGTTYGGGGSGCVENGCGTVFSIDLTTGTEAVVHSFGNGTDGAQPIAGLIHVKGTLYGTTVFGGGTGCGGDGCGTVFSIDPATGTEAVVYSFGGGTDGAWPYAGLLHVKGTLYGTTKAGGTYGNGAVFALDPATGAETIVHSFGSGTDGVNPIAGLIDVNGTLYGTTLSGGTFKSGTVFSVDPATGAETVVYSFGSSNTDGIDPYAGLTDVKGKLYGTTEFGGGTSDSGTIFSIDLATGAENIKYSFCSQQFCADGGNPYAGLINVKDVLYGTTTTGGSEGGGTVFELKLK